MKNFIEKEIRLSEKERRNLSILDSIRKGREISRADISRVTDLNIVTVSNYVSKYIKNKIVIETGLDISSGGRRPELLKLNPEYGYSVGIDLGACHLTASSRIVAILMDVTGKVIAEEKIKKEQEPFEKLMEKVLSLTDNLVKKSSVPPSKIKGIGIGIWGIIDRYRSMTRYPAGDEPGINYSALLKQLEDKLGVSVLIEHDSALAAFGEKWSGIGTNSDTENLVFLCSDSSCGMIIRGELYHGASKNAGELNLKAPDSEKKEDFKNCWSTYNYGCCLRSRGIDLGVIDRIKARLERQKIEQWKYGEVSFENAVNAASEGDSLAKEVIEEAGDYLGAKIAFLVNLFNPEIVVIGRGIEKGGSIFFSAIRKSVRRWSYDETVKVVKILPTSVGENVVAVGAGAVVIQNLFAKG
ncbi:MAG: ROK family protein [Candidatus Omnitrophota bacterium]